jgi:integrase
MKGYVARKGDRWYAVIYDGLDPVTGRERRRWRPAGANQADAERLAHQLAAERNGRNDEARSLSFGAYLTTRWLPGKRLSLRPTTWDGYRRKVDRHILPTIGHVPIRRLRPAHLETRYDSKLHPIDGRRALAPKTVLEVHLIIRGALADAVRHGVIARNVALVAHAPRLRSIPKVEPQPWNAEQLRAFLQASAGHRLLPAFWLLAATGMRRNEVLGLRWDDIDFQRRTIALNRGIVAVGYELHETRGKTRNARRPINLDTTTADLLQTWRSWQAAEQRAVGIDGDDWVFSDPAGQPIHPHAISQAFERLARRAGIPVIRLHDVRHTHATLLIKAGVPVKVASERLGHATAAFTIETYQHVMPGMQADAARVAETLLTPASPPTVPPATSTASARLKRRRNTA